VTDSGAPALSDTALVTIQLNDLVGVADPIDLGGDTGGGGNPTPELEPDPEPQPASVIAIGGDADGQVPGGVTGQTEPAPIVQRESTPIKVVQSERLEIDAKTPDTNRSSEHTVVFSEALEIMSEGVGTTNILEEAMSNPLQATFKDSTSESLR